MKIRNSYIPSKWCQYLRPRLNGLRHQNTNYTNTNKLQKFAILRIYFLQAQVTETYNQRIIKLGRDLQDHLVQLSTEHTYP